MVIVGEEEVEGEVVTEEGWKCSKGQEWEAIVGNRSQCTGCPYCTQLLG
ncbi:zinc-ribbon domain-containing protein [Chloroflexota bacterium]